MKINENISEDIKKNINPSHYKYAKIEPISIIEEDFPLDQQIGFFKGLIFKYLFRCEHKNGLEDYLKSKYYLDRLIQAVEKNLDEYKKYCEKLKNTSKKV